MLSTILTLLVATFFLLMGLVALIDPGCILTPFGLHNLTLDAENEIRAVYGGFGVAMALLLAASLQDEELRAGVALTVAIALVGMAGGRAMSALIARQMGRFPWYFFIVEIVLAVMLLTAR